MKYKLPDLSRTPRLETFVSQMTNLISETAVESEILSRGRFFLEELVRHDDWLPAEFQEADPVRYQQYLLYADSADRFSVVSFVWGPDQFTPVHNHTVWGLVGILRGCEETTAFLLNEAGKWVPEGPSQKMKPGEVDCVSPTVGDVHQVRNALTDQVSISIHVYGANIGKVKRSVFLEDGSSKNFISGYSNSI